MCIRDRREHRQGQPQIDGTVFRLVDIAPEKAYHNRHCVFVFVREEHQRCEHEIAGGMQGGQSQNSAVCDKC